MNIVPVPENAKRHYPNHTLINMGPPAGVSDDYCGTAQMLLGHYETLPGFNGRDQLAFYRPTQYELDQLNAGALLVMNQIGNVVQPFSLSVWPAEKEV